MITLLQELRESSQLAFGRLSRAATAKQAWGVKVKLAKAKAYKAIKATPTKFGLSKCTEKAVEFAIITHPDVKDAETNYLKACDTFNKADSKIHRLNYDIELLKLQVQLIIHDVRE